MPHEVKFTITCLVEDRESEGFVFQYLHDLLGEIHEDGVVRDYNLSKHMSLPAKKELLGSMRVELESMRAQLTPGNNPGIPFLARLERLRSSIESLEAGIREEEARCAENVSTS